MLTRLLPLNCVVIKIAKSSADGWTEMWIMPINSSAFIRNFFYILLHCGWRIFSSLLIADIYAYHYKGC